MVIFFFQFVKLLLSLKYNVMNLLEWKIEIYESSIKIALKKKTMNIM